MTNAVVAAPSDIVRGDLERDLEYSSGLWRRFMGARIFVTGGTGFVGKWLLESLAHANERLALGVTAVVLSRDPARFSAAYPHLARDPALRLLRGDIRSFQPPAGEFSHVIHAATDVTSPGVPLEAFYTIVDGTRAVMNFCAERRIGNVLLVSSGAVYGTQPPDLALVPEDYAGAPATTSPQSAYGQGKRAAEWLAVARCPQAVRIARCFAFVGPYLPLDGVFAIGNFIADKRAARPIEVRGDGTPMRSYLYASDLARWLWTLLAQGAAGEAYNVGSEEALSVGELARRIAAADAPEVPVNTPHSPVPGIQPARYVPSTRKARERLGLTQTVCLAEGISRTLAWARAR